MMTGLLPLFILAHFSHHFTAAIFQPLTPFIRDQFALDYKQVGWIMSAYNIAYGVSHLPAGWLSDRLGPRIMIIFMIMLGLMGGGYHPAASPLVSTLVDKKDRGSALGLHQIGGTASFFLTPSLPLLSSRRLAGAGPWSAWPYPPSSSASCSSSS